MLKIALNLYNVAEKIIAIGIQNFVKDLNFDKVKEDQTIFQSFSELIVVHNEELAYSGEDLRWGFVVLRKVIDLVGMLFEVLGMSFEVLGMVFEVKFYQS